VAPDGRVTYLTEGVLRLLHGGSTQDALPYEHPGPPRSFLRADAGPLHPDEVIRVDLPLFATSVRLAAGHRVRMAIAGHDASTFARYPQDGEAVLTVAYSRVDPSFLELPTAME
jgi:predicted acyl esterase